MSKPERVLVINYKMQCAGIESFIMNMYRNIDRSKVQYDFLVHYKEEQFYDKEIEELGGKIYRLSVREDNNFLKYFRELKKFFKEHNEYKIVHGHMESFGVFYLKAAKKAGVKIRIAHSHIAQRNKTIKGFIKSVLNKGYGKYATHLFACSELAGKFMFGDRAEFKICNNAIDIKKFVYSKDVRNQVREEIGILDSQFVVGHVGRFEMQKNHIMLIDIFAEIYKKDQNAVLILFGEGSLEDKIKAKVKSYNLTENVKFMGVRDDMHRMYQAMDVFVMPSLFEGLPVTGIEAQVSGLKCIFADTITKETSITENTEYIALDESVEFWRNKILESTNGYERKNLIQELSNSEYNVEVQAKKLQNLYLELCKKG